MKKQLTGIILAATAFFAASSTTFAVPITDVQDYSNNLANEYFVIDDASKFDSPYYRDSDEDWGWTHTAMAGTFSSISLEISAFDVDLDGWDFDEAEHDIISIFDGSDWVEVGELAGSDDIWEFTTFDLTSYSWAQDQVNDGLQVRIDIDALDQAWLVTLGKATLTLDGGSLECVPTPGVPCTVASVPEPSIIALLGLGLIGFGFARKQTKRS